MRHPLDEDLDAWTYSLLAPTEAHALERHVAECADCEVRLREAARLSALLVAAVPAQPRSWITRKRVLALALAAAALAPIFWAHQQPPPVPTKRSATQDDALLRLHARELESLGRVVRYETLPDPSWQPDDPS